MKALIQVISSSNDIISISQPDSYGTLLRKVIEEIPGVVSEAVRMIGRGIGTTTVTSTPPGDIFSGPGGRGRVA